MLFLENQDLINCDRLSNCSTKSSPPESDSKKIGNFLANDRHSSTANIVQTTVGSCKQGNKNTGSGPDAFRNLKRM